MNNHILISKIFSRSTFLVANIWVLFVPFDNCSREKGILIENIFYFVEKNVIISRAVCTHKNWNHIEQIWNFRNATVIFTPFFVRASEFSSWCRFALDISLVALVITGFIEQLRYLYNDVCSVFPVWWKAWMPLTVIFTPLMSTILLKTSPVCHQVFSQTFMTIKYLCSAYGNICLRLLEIFI